MIDEIIDVVDEKDNIIGEAPKSECHTKGLWHRAASIFVMNKEGKLLVQKRAPHVPRPNLFCSSASGHLEKRESYEAGAQRELQEELGINCQLQFIDKLKMDVVYPDGKIDREHYVLFVCYYDGPIEIQMDELSSVNFFAIDVLQSMIKSSPDKFTPGFRQEFQYYLNFRLNQNLSVRSYSQSR